MSTPTTFNRHYPFAQRQYAFLFPWKVTKLALQDLSITEEIPKGNGEDLFGDDITLLIDEPNLVPPFTPHHGNAKTHEYGVTSSTPVGLDAGWTVSMGVNRSIRHGIQIRNVPVGLSDALRPARRVWTLDFGVATSVSLTVTATGPSGSYTINFAGYWRNLLGGITPGFPNDYWESADTPPTLHRIKQRGHRDYARQFSPADWTQTTRSTGSSGTVPSTVSAFMNDWLDALDTTISGATIDCVWRMAGIGYAIPMDLGNRNFIVQSTIADNF